MFRSIFKLSVVSLTFLSFSNFSFGQFFPRIPGVPVYPYWYFATNFNVGNLGQNYNLTYYRATPMGYGYSAAPSYSPVYASQTKAIEDARRNLNSVPSTLIPDQSNRVEIRTERSPAELFNGYSTSFKTAVNSPADQDILNGSALNEILSTVIDLEKRGFRVNGSFLAPELAGVIQYSNNANGDLSNWIHAGAIDFPKVLLSDDFQTARAWLKHDFALVATQLKAGKTPDSSLYQALLTAGKTLRRTLNDRKSNLNAEEFKTGEQFLNRFDGVVSIIRTPATADLVTSDWSALGVSVNDLIDHMSRFKLQFGPAAAGSESAYRNLHYALADYATSLVDSKR